MVEFIIMVICSNMPVWYSRGVLLRSQAKRTGGGAGGAGFLLFHFDFKGLAVLIAPMLGTTTTPQAMQKSSGSTPSNTESTVTA
jgi:hypothetical protein